MPALNYKTQFAPMVENGLCAKPDPQIPIKRQTIRAGNRIKVGDTLIHYVGQRTKQCRKLGKSTCRSADFIEIQDPYLEHVNTIHVRGHFLTPAQATELAIADGFKTLEQFFEFFRYQHGFPFRGQLIEW